MSGRLELSNRLHEGFSHARGNVTAGEALALGQQPLPRPLTQSSRLGTEMQPKQLAPSLPEVSMIINRFMCVCGQAPQQSQHTPYDDMIRHFCITVFVALVINICCYCKIIRR